MECYTKGESNVALVCRTVLSRISSLSTIQTVTITVKCPRALFRLLFCFLSLATTILKRCGTRESLKQSPVSLGGRDSYRGPTHTNISKPTSPSLSDFSSSKIAFFVANASSNGCSDYVGWVREDVHTKRRYAVEDITTPHPALLPCFTATT
jgi:hypothetical protein